MQVAIGLLCLAGTGQAKAPQAAVIYPPQTEAGATVVCADVIEEGFGEASLWVTGFVSGMNAATYQMVSHSTTTSGLLGEVKLYCTRHPSDTLMNAVFKTYESMKAAGK
jgi:hypothetical protein